MTDRRFRAWPWAVLVPCLACPACGGPSSHPDPAPQVLALTAPASTLAGAPLVLTVSSPDGPFDATVTFRSADATAVLPGATHLSLGPGERRELEVTLRRAGSQTISAVLVPSGRTAGVTTVEVSAGRATALSAVLAEGEARCPPFEVALAATDPFGNADPAYRGKVHFTAPPSRYGIPADHIFTEGDAGRHVFAVAGELDRPRRLTVTDGAGALAATDVTLEPSGWCAVGPAAGDVVALAVDPDDPRTVFAATVGGVFATGDGGLTWQGHVEGLSEGRFVFALAMVPGTPPTLLAGLHGGLFARPRGAPAWTRVHTGINEGGQAKVIAVDPGRPSVVYVGSGVGVNGVGVLRSLDGGFTWTTANDGLPGAVVGVTGLAVAPDDSSVYAAFGSAGVFRSTDTGATWQPAGLSGFEVLDLAASTSGRVWASTPVMGIFASDDHGASWSVMGRFGLDVAIDPGDAGTIWIASSIGVQRSTDGGVGWGPPQGLPSTVLAFAGGPGGFLYAGTFGEGVARSEDAGVSWVSSNAGLTSGVVFSMAATDERLYAGFRGGWVFQSADRGATWVRAHVGNDGDVEALVVDPVTPTTLFAVSGEVLKSSDGGATWARCEGSEGARTLAMDPLDPSRLHAGTQLGLLESADGGATWAPGGLQGEWVFSIAPHPSVAGLLYAYGDQGLHRSLDGGVSWKATGGLGGGIDPGVVLVLADGTVIEGGAWGLHRSVDGGATFVSTTSFPQPYVLALAKSPHDPSVVLAATPDTVLRSADGGRTWASLRAGLPPGSQPRALLVDSVVPSVLYAGTYGSSVYRWDAGD